MLQWRVYDGDKDSKVLDQLYFMEELLWKIIEKSFDVSLYKYRRRMRGEKKSNGNIYTSFPFLHVPNF